MTTDERRRGHADAVLDPSFVDETLDSRSVTSENPTGGRGCGGMSYGGRKGRGGQAIRAGEKAVLAEIEGPGTLRHFWIALPPLDGSPESLRSLRLEGYYDEMSEPSISVPLLDFFGLPHGRLT